MFLLPAIIILVLCLTVMVGIRFLLYEIRDHWKQKRLTKMIKEGNWGDNNTVEIYG